MILLDMEIPKNCFDCRFRTATGECELTGLYTSHKALTMPLSESCPIKAKIPKDATNGDVIKALFPKYHQTLLLYLDNTRWWNAPWKGQKNEFCK